MAAERGRVFLLLFMHSYQQFNHQEEVRQGDIISNEVRRGVSHSTLLVLET